MVDRSFRSAGGDGPVGRAPRVLPPGCAAGRGLVVAVAAQPRPGAGRGYLAAVLHLQPCRIPERAVVAIRGVRQRAACAACAAGGGHRAGDVRPGAIAAQHPQPAAGRR
ncbi:hypothetical protein G6F35_014375 [Rhizopus arrhizus]|nr:hypothetical protein G6F24_016897 [Rhizopus arrhizus]KAG1187839.1 hypothetical protein G6F35_014375 [Rhizopus arrhizus]